MRLYCILIVMRNVSAQFEDDVLAMRAGLTPEQRAEGEMYGREILLANTITDLRRARGLTQMQLAELSGVPQGQVRGIECAVGVNPTQKTLLKLAWALDADLCIVPRDAATS